MKYWILLLLVILCIPGDDVVRGQSQEDFLDRQKIQSLCVLPPLGQSVPNSTRQASADLLITKLKLWHSAVRIVTPEELMPRLHEKGLTSDLSSFINLFVQTGTVDPAAIKKMGEAAGADALLLINVLNYDEEKGSWWYGKGGKNLCRIQYTLFRTSDGQDIWQSLEFRQHDSKLSTRPYPMERVVGDVSEKAVTSLLTGKQNTDVRRKHQN